MNKVILIGNVGKDPDVRYYGADQAIATLRLATTEKGYTLQNGTKVPDRTDWHTLIFYRRLAKVVEQYVHKGDKIYIDGRLQYRNYDDKKGIQHIATDTTLIVTINTTSCIIVTNRNIANNTVADINAASYFIITNDA